MTSSTLFYDYRTSSRRLTQFRCQLKQVIDIIAPFVVELFNRSLSEGRFPAVFKQAFVTPVVKKPGLDATDTSSYRPISNLSVLSKLLERLVVSQLS